MLVSFKRICHDFFFVLATLMCGKSTSVFRIICVFEVYYFWNKYELDNISLITNFKSITNQLPEVRLATTLCPLS